MGFSSNCNYSIFIFIVSEALLFISFFWAALHVISSPSFVQEGFFSPDPCQLPYSNTVLLSHAACSLGAAFVGLEISCSSSIFFSFISLTLAWAFISLQIYEFWIMGISLVDSVYGSIFYFNWTTFLSPYSRNDDDWYGILGTNISKKWICLSFKTNYRYSLIL